MDSAENRNPDLGTDRLLTLTLSSVEEQREAKAGLIRLFTLTSPRSRSRGKPVGVSARTFGDRWKFALPGDEIQVLLLVGVRRRLWRDDGTLRAHGAQRGRLQGISRSHRPTAQRMRMLRRLSVRADARSV